ncbi:hypothetical protein M3C10_04835 [Micrococcus luteus]|nr:hypothetical protein [Micrococcus luteus]
MTISAESTTSWLVAPRCTAREPAGSCARSAFSAGIRGGAAARGRAGERGEVVGVRVARRRGGRRLRLRGEPVPGEHAHPCRLDVEQVPQEGAVRGGGLRPTAGPGRIQEADVGDGGEVGGG